jgi:hypothetical protein
VLEGMPRIEMAVEVAPAQLVDSSERHEVRVRAPRIQRVELNATQVGQQRTGTFSTRGMDDPVQAVLADEKSPRLIACDSARRDRFSRNCRHASFFSPHCRRH